MSLGYVPQSGISFVEYHRRTECWKIIHEIIQLDLEEELALRELHQLVQSPCTVDRYHQKTKDFMPDFMFSYAAVICDTSRISHLRGMLAAAIAEHKHTLTNVWNADLLNTVQVELFYADRYDGCGHNAGLCPRPAEVTSSTGCPDSRTSVIARLNNDGASVAVNLNYFIPNNWTRIVGRKGKSFAVPHVFIDHWGGLDYVKLWLGALSNFEIMAGSPLGRLLSIRRNKNELFADDLSGWSR